MATLTIKGMQDELYELLKQRARSHRRSINAEVIMCVERAVCSRRLDPDVFLGRMADIRSSRDYPMLSDELLEQYKAEGRA